MRLLFSMFFLLLTNALYAAETMKWEEKEYDFGKVELGSGPVYHRFVFKNEGKEPLLIRDVVASCGCVSAGWTKTPVAVGDTGSVCVRYKNNVSGVFHKTVKVVSTAKGSKKVPLIIKGETVKK
ncbi:MAG: DUF1573 domain-containing protein [Paludibacteraceae bacterium]|nr:DUF1573 domain-containing protein [Paludibacteraceae bacterium]